MFDLVGVCSGLQQQLQQFNVARFRCDGQWELVTGPSEAHVLRQVGVGAVAKKALGGVGEPLPRIDI